jgi:4-hydroxybenzoate polyprenyltransferase
MVVGRSAVRAQQWWDYKIPPVLASALLLVGAGGRSRAWAEIGMVLLFLVAAAGTAAFGHVVNDLADIGTDARAGKRNVMSMMSSPERVSLCGATLAVGLVPFGWLPHGGWVVALVAVEVGLLVTYSVPPIRLKGRAVAGVLADASYAYVVPVGLTIAVFAGRAVAPAVRWWVVTPVLAWACLMGVRGIVSHQIDDAENDRRADVDTLVRRVGAERALAWASRLVVVELGAAAVAVAAVSVAARSGWLGVFAAGYLAWRMFQVWFLWDEPLLAAAVRDREARLRLIGFVLLNEFVERWLPLAALVALALDRRAWWFVVAVYLLAFDNALVEFVSRDARTLPDALERLALQHRARRSIRRAASTRRAMVAAGPSAAPGLMRERRRWVFVVCGPAMHIHTLRTAVANLRPLTSLEVWVLTDSSRNEIELDTTGIDRIVDVRSPERFDDHQASIWLKTGIHRHLPEGEWCYLDTDVIAVAPGMEEVFDHRHGPVAFASDITIVENQVDRFSPWAMTCDCAGLGDDHSCGHLREQLGARFDLEVPGDWLHWNGGVFVFGPDAAPFLDLWCERSIASFDWPEWRTRDQGTLIATVWSLGLQDLPRLPSTFNFIADLGNGDLCLDPDRGWAAHPAGPWLRPRFMHLYTSALEDPDWDLGRDVEAVVIRQSVVRTVRWQRGEHLATIKRVLNPTLDVYHPMRWNVTFALRDRLGLYALRLRRFPRRLNPSRVLASLRRRLGGTSPIRSVDGEESWVRTAPPPVESPGRG